MAINEERSYTEYNVEVPTTDFPIGFNILDDGIDVVAVTLNDVDPTTLGYTVIQVNSTTYRFAPAVPSGVVRLTRITDIDQMAHVFTEGAIFISENMDGNFKQIRHAQQEVRDGFNKLSTDTYVIIDTLQVVGEAAKDAAAAAEAAAELANDAAAAVNDKVSYSDLDNAVDIAVAPIKDYVALPYEPLKSYKLYERVRLENGDIVKSTVADNVIDPNVDMTGWFNPNEFIKDKTISLLDFGSKGDGLTDDSVSIGLASTYSSMYKRKISGVGKTYACSNVFFDSHCYLSDAYLVNNGNADLISVLTTTVSTDWLENVTFDNIHIDGKRIDQTGVKVTSSSEDGGRHGFRFRRPCRNITLKNSGSDYCAGDGIIIFPTGEPVKDEFLIQNFVIENCHFNWNRRHGGSSDRVKGLTLINTQCNKNGRYLEGHASDPASSGAQGDRVNSNTVYYGNGWDSEEYYDDAISVDLSFINCQMIDNAKGGLLVLSKLGATRPTFDTNIKIIGGKYNRGVLNSSDIIAITITPNGITNTLDIFRNTLISDVTVPATDSVLLRNNKAYIFTNTPCILTAVEYSEGYYDQSIKSVNSATSSKNFTSIKIPSGKIEYQNASNALRYTDVSILQYNASTHANAKQERYYYNLTQYGKQTVSLSVDGTSRFALAVNGSNTTEQFVVDKSGVKLNLTQVNDPSVNGDMTFDLLNNTSLRVKVKGADGVVRIATITLA